MGFLIQARVEKMVYGVETLTLFSKENVLGVVVNKGHVNSLLEHQRINHY